jgi:hypothetical protein
MQWCRRKSPYRTRGEKKGRKEREKLNKQIFYHLRIEERPYVSLYPSSSLV